MAIDTEVEALNEGLNTPTDEDDGYGQEEETEESSESEDDTENESEEATEEGTATKASDEAEEDEAKPLTRGQQRIQSLANEKKLAEQRAELLERQLEMERAQRNAPQQRPQEDENLTDLEKWQRQADQTIRQVQFQNLDMQDRSDFLTAVSKNAAEAAYIDRVEQTLAEARKMGVNPKREDVLIRLMGIDARSKMKQAPAVKRDAAQRVSAAKGKPLVSKSNVVSTKTESSEFDRLKDIIL